MFLDTFQIRQHRSPAELSHPPARCLGLLRRPQRRRAEGGQDANRPASGAHRSGSPWAAGDRPAGRKTGCPGGPASTAGRATTSATCSTSGRAAGARRRAGAPLSSSSRPDQPLQRAAQRDAGAMFLDKPADCRQRPPDGKLRPSDPRLGLLRRPQRRRAEGGQDARRADTERPSAPGLTGGGSRAVGPALVCGLGVWRLSAGRCAGSCEGRKRRYGRALAVL